MHYNSIYKPALFAGKTVILTGGGTGLGRCTAHELAALGAEVALVGRTRQKLQTTAQEISDDGGTASTYECDIRESDRVSAVVDEILARHGRIDGLVNNAGGQYPAMIRDTKTKGWEAVVRTNLTGGFIFSREVYLRWMEKNGGAIVNIVADVDGGCPGFSHSGAARAGMINFTESAASEWAVSGVRVNAVAPGCIDGVGLDQYPADLRQPYLENWKYRVPMQRFGTESEVSAAIVFLLSPGAAFITGSVLRVDGGALNARNYFDLPRHDNSPVFEAFHRAKPAARAMPR